MKKLLVRSALVSTLAAAAALAPAGPAVASPGDGCAFYVQQVGQASNCTWYADVNGEAGGASGGPWYVLQWVPGTSSTPSANVLCDASTTTNCWKAVAQGSAGPIAVLPGTITAGHYYSLAITGPGAGAMGSITGTGTI